MNLGALINNKTLVGAIITFLIGGLTDANIISLVPPTVGHILSIVGVILGALGIHGEVVAQGSKS